MFENVVIPIDLSEKFSWKAVMPPVLNMVTAFNSNIHLVHIIPDFGMNMVEDYLPKNWVKDQKKKSEEHIEALIKKYIPKEVNTTYYVGRGAVYDEVIQYTTKVGADLIVLSAVRPELRDYMLGPNA